MPPMRRGTSPRRAPADLNEVLMNSMNGTSRGVGDELPETTRHSTDHSLHPRGCAKAKHHATVRKWAAPEHHPLLNDCFSVRYMAATDADPTVEVF